jgi:protease-4
MIGASGGYYVSCACDKIFSDPNALTGSIGARVSFIYYYDLLKKIGIYEKTIKSGKYKDIGSPFREMTKEEEKIIEEFINDI